MADGPANQAACERALKSGTSVRGVLECVRTIRRTCEVPLLFFTYINPVLAYGLERFAREAVDAGVDGILPLDAPPDEDTRVRSVLAGAGLDTVCLAAPTTPSARRRMLAKASRGVLYYVCRLGVTGGERRLAARRAARADAPRSRQVSRPPVCIGFGISYPAAGAARPRRPSRRRRHRRQPPGAPDRGAWRQARPGRCRRRARARARPGRARGALSHGVVPQPRRPAHELGRPPA